VFISVVPEQPAGRCLQRLLQLMSSLSAAAAEEELIQVAAAVVVI
jgi:hypothetical protein